MDSISPRFPLLRFAALFHDIGKVPTKTIDNETGGVHFFNHEGVGAELVENICIKFKFSNDEIKYVTTIIKNHMYFVTQDTKDKAIKKWITSNPFYRDNLRLRIADRKGNLAKAGKVLITFYLKDLIRKIKRIEATKQPMKITDLVVNGHDLIELGLKPGPIFGKVLNHLLEQVLDNPDNNNREYLLAEVKNSIK
jgi:poly(A) polymerase/tRNA nucleotidyltransferase (CCA-adding enzyme)